MHNYYNKLVQKSEKYAVKYANRPRFAALKMIFWNLGCIFKKQNPNIKIVQLGVSKDRCESVSNVDINLVGQTTFADVLTLLTKSILHIDGDCGMVHLRHFLCKKPSLVLWGPTSPKLRGYPENINLRANVCNCEFCEWLVGERWQTHCIKTNSCHGLCMEMLSPQYAFEHIKHLI